MTVLAGAESFTYTGSTRAGVLLCHGFIGTPASMRHWGEHLGNAAGFTVRCPRLPGHGTTWQECNRTHWTEWYRRLREEFASLAGTCDAVFVYGLSVGSTLALRPAQELGDAVAGMALVNPSVRAAASLHDLWKLVRQNLYQITQPLLVLHSLVDRVGEPVNSQIIAGSVRSTRLTTVALHNSYHVATLDNDAPLIFRKSVEFVQSVRQVDAR